MMKITDSERAEIRARVLAEHADALDKMADQIIDPASSRKGLRSAAAITRQMACDALKVSIKELRGTCPLVLFFGSEKDRDEFIMAVASVKPDLVVRKLA